MSYETVIDIHDMPEKFEEIVAIHKRYKKIIRATLLIRRIMICTYFISTITCIDLYMETNPHSIIADIICIIASIVSCAFCILGIINVSKYVKKFYHSRYASLQFDSTQLHVSLYKRRITIHMDYIPRWSTLNETVGTSNLATTEFRKLLSEEKDLRKVFIDYFELLPTTFDNMVFEDGTDISRSPLTIESFIKTFIFPFKLDPHYYFSSLCGYEFFIAA